MNYVYLLRCADGSLYCGWTKDLEARVTAHNEGRGAKYTRSRRPVVLLYSEAYEDPHDARSREWHIKRLPKAEKEALIQAGEGKMSEGNNMALSVRPAQPEDIPAILNLLVQVDLVHHEGRPDLFKGPATKYDAEQLAVLLRTPDTPVFVCVDENGEVIGHGFCILEHYGNHLMTERTTLYIDDICVDRSARGKGAGRALYKHIVRYAREAGCYNVTLNVWTCNPGAMAFYEKLGLRPYKVGMEEIL